MVMFSLNFVKGSKSVEGGPNPLADMDRGGFKSASGYGPEGPYPLADLDRGGPILGGSKSARTPVSILFSPTG